MLKVFVTRLESGQLHQNKLIRGSIGKISQSDQTYFHENAAFSNNSHFPRTSSALYLSYCLYKHKMGEKYLKKIVIKKKKLFKQNNENQTYRLLKIEYFLQNIKKIYSKKIPHMRVTLQVPSNLKRSTKTESRPYLIVIFIQ